MRFAILAALALAALAFGQDFGTVTTADITTTSTLGYFRERPLNIAREDISKVDFSTNKATAKVWSELSTNIVTKRINQNFTYAIYCEGGCPEIYTFARTTTILLARFAEVEGIRVQLNSRPVYQTNETFTVPTQ